MTLATIRNAAGMALSLTTVGASVMRLTVPTTLGVERDVVLGLADEEAYRTNPGYMGPLVGRVAGRIWPPRVRIAGRIHDLQVNEGLDVHLHGGVEGWSRCDWTVLEQTEAAITLARDSPDGEGGYPGAVRAQVRYALTPDSAWTVEVSATADAETPISMTQHAYFNLAGGDGAVVENHTLRLTASQAFTLADNGAADGTMTPVEGSALDFRSAAALGPRLATLGELDHCFRIDGDEAVLRLAAQLRCPGSPLGLDVLTDQPALQVYAGGRLDGTLMGRHGRTHRRYAGICLETQSPPNALHHPGLGSILLAPGQRYERRTEYRFVSVRT